MIPIAGFQHQARAALTRHSASRVESHVSGGLGHSIDNIGLQLGGQFLARVLRTSRSPHTKRGGLIEPYAGAPSSHSTTSTIKDEAEHAAQARPP